MSIFRPKPRLLTEPVLVFPLAVQQWHAEMAAAEAEREKAVNLFEDGRAYEFGAVSDLGVAMAGAQVMLDDRGHGARRAMLVLAGYCGVDTSAVAA